MATVSSADLNASVYAMVGNREKTLMWLERVREAHDLPDAKVNPVFDFLHGDPEYVALLERMGLNRGEQGAGHPPPHSTSHPQF